MDLVITKLSNAQYTFFCRSDVYDKYKSVKSIKDLENVPLVLPVPGTTNRKMLDELFIQNNTNPKKVINIHTSEVILNGVKNNLGVGYIISDLIKNDDNFKIIKIKEKLPASDIVLVYNKQFLTNAPKRFIEEYINYEIK